MRGCASACLQLLEILNVQCGEGKCEVRGDLGDKLGAVVARLTVCRGTDDDGEGGGLGDILGDRVTLLAVSGLLKTEPKSAPGLVALAVSWP